ncbi:hypothetical protein [Caulobacter endophyticus]|uniref:hypothetical protein n=1 Tax=Caulobacter endophyticus TaxID=2172652 RepID=UPI00240FD9ED|nr:hypothetical protein [Caulobacter endophyticus]MDG2529969.1 hypothetical protein [Caulobacter endophyticus]
MSRKSYEQQGHGQRHGQSWPGLGEAPEDAPAGAFGRLGVSEAELSAPSVLHSDFQPPSIRARLHVLCALYAHTPSPARRLELLDSLEGQVLELAHLMALDLLANGWRPEPGRDAA